MVRINVRCCSVSTASVLPGMLNKFAHGSGVAVQYGVEYIVERGVRHGHGSCGSSARSFHFVVAAAAGSRLSYVKV